MLGCYPHLVLVVRGRHCVCVCVCDVSEARAVQERVCTQAESTTENVANSPPLA